MVASLYRSSWARQTLGVVATLVSSAAVLAGAALAQMFLADPSLPSAVTPTSPGSITAAGGSTRVVLRFERQVATAVLDDTAVAEEFTAMLPLTLNLSDPMGQAKSGRLPDSGSLDVTGVHPVLKTTVGELSYWAPSATVAVVYDDLGQGVPDPGLVRLGVIDTGLADIAAAGNQFTMRVELAPQSHY